MAHLLNTPLSSIIAELCLKHELEPEDIEGAETLVQSMLDDFDCNQKDLAEAMLVLGWAYRQAHRYDDATRMYIHAKGRFIENPLDASVEAARALWFLGEAHYFHCNFTIAREVFWKAVKMYCSTAGLLAEETLACLREFRDFACGFAKDEELTSEVDVTIGFAHAVGVATA